MTSHHTKAYYKLEDYNKNAWKLSNSEGVNQENLKNNYEF